MRNYFNELSRYTILTAMMLIFSFSVQSADIGDFKEVKPIIDLVRTDGSLARQQSTLFSFNGNMVSMANGGGQMMYRSDISDSSTSIRELRNQNGCSDIEGGYQFGDNVLLADERTPAVIYIMPNPESLGKCTEAIESFTLSGFDETSGSFGIEGVAVLQDGRFVAVKQNSPPRIGVFDYVSGTANYNPVDLFPLSGCNNIGDVTIRPNGNIILICKTQQNLQEFTIDGNLISTLDISDFDKPEGVVEMINFIGDNNLCVLGEASQYKCFTEGDVVVEPPTEPPVVETCTIESGEVLVDNDVRLVSTSLNVVCESFSGTIDVETTIQ